MEQATRHSARRSGRSLGTAIGRWSATGLGFGLLALVGAVAISGFGPRADDAVGRSGALVQQSDARLKSDVRPIGPAMPDLLALDPVRFHWKANPKAGEQLGFIAQLVQPVVPEVVEKADDEEGTLSIAYGSLVPLLVKGAQEHDATLGEHRRQIGELQRAVEQLHGELKAQATEIACLRKELAELKAAIANKN